MWQKCFLFTVSSTFSFQFFILSRFPPFALVCFDKKREKGDPYWKCVLCSEMEKFTFVWHFLMYVLRVKRLVWKSKWQRKFYSCCLWVHFTLFFLLETELGCWNFHILNIVKTYFRFSSARISYGCYVCHHGRNSRKHWSENEKCLKNLEKYLNHSTNHSRKPKWKNGVYHHYVCVCEWMWVWVGGRKRRIQIFKFILSKEICVDRHSVD